MEKLILNKPINLDVEVSVMDVAKLFCDMDEKQQAVFFNSVGQLSSSWQGSFSYQMQCVLDSGELNDRGRYIMSEIGLYSKHDI